MILEGTNIQMIRGDSESILVTMKNEQNEKVDLVDGDTIFFTVKDHINTEDKIFQKVITNFEDGNAVIDIKPLDTKSLKYWTYVYDIQLTTLEGNIKTIIPVSKLTIMGEVTYE